MKSGDLKETVAQAMLVDPEKVWVTMRNLRENDLLTTGARGVNAPDLTYRDAARVLLAHILNSNPGRAAPRMVNAFGPLPWSNPAACEDLSEYEEPFTLGDLLPDQSKNTFEEALAGLIRVFVECRDGTAFRLAGSLRRDRTLKNPPCLVEIFEEDAAATISMGNVQYSFNARPISVRDSTREHSDQTRLGRQCIAFVNQEVIARIADGFREGK